MKRVYKQLQNPRIKAYFWTFLTQMIVLGGAFLMMKVAGQQFGKEGFGEYNVARRLISTMAFPLLLGLGISLTRYLAATQQAASLLPAGLLLLLPLNAIILILGWLYPSYWADLFLGNEQYSILIMPILFSTLGMELYTLLYAYCRGRQIMTLANIWQILIMILIPLGWLWQTYEPAVVWNGIGWSWILLNTSMLIYVLSKLDYRDVDKQKIKSQMKLLLAFGLPRIPGEFALFGLLSIPIFVINKQMGAVIAGYVSIGFSFLQLIVSLFDFFGLLLLPQVSQWWAENRYDEVRKTVHRILVIALCTSVLASLCLAGLMKWAILLLMGNDFIEALDICRILVLVSVPYTIYTVLRNPLDGISTYPYNTQNLLLSLALLVCMLVVGVWFNLIWMLLYGAVALSLGLLGILTWFSWRKESMSEKYE
jgi:O-antigen/teichoic acid export membrane protein